MAEDWQAMLKDLRWSKAELARRLGVHANTVLGWKDGAPDYALAYLRLAVRAKELGDQVR